MQGEALADRLLNQADALVAATFVFMSWVGAAVGIGIVIVIGEGNG